MAALAEGFYQVLDLVKLSYFNDENTTETGQRFYMNGPFKVAEHSFAGGQR